MPPGPDATIALRAQGTATAEGLRQARELGFVSRLARDASGGAAYNLGIVFRRGVPEVTVTSNLQGLALNLPAPLAKPADQVMPLRYENVLVRDAAAGGAAGPIAGPAHRRTRPAGVPSSMCGTCPARSRASSAAASPSAWRPVNRRSCPSRA